MAFIPQSLRSSIDDVASRLGIPASWLTAVIQFETGGTFSPAITNSIGATGLIQFLPSTARQLGTTVESLRTMSGPEQMEYVYQYLAPYRGRMWSIEDAYMAVLWPAAVGKPQDYVLFRNPSAAYIANKGLDINRDGVVTKQEAASMVVALQQPGEDPGISFTPPSPGQPLGPANPPPIDLTDLTDPEPTQDGMDHATDGAINYGLVAIVGVGVFALAYLFGTSK